MEKICGLDVSSAQVSQAAAMLDAELARWRDRPLGEVRYLVLDAHYERARAGGGDRVLPCAVLVAVGVLPDGRRMVLGAGTACSEAETNWREFLFALARRGMHGVTYAVSDDHAGLKAALATCLPAAAWQRCQFHLVRNALHKVPRQDARAAVAKDLRHVLDAADRPEATRRLHAMVDRDPHWPGLADWLEENVPESFACYDLPPDHRRRMRTSNMLERLNREIARRTNVVGVFPARGRPAAAGDRAGRRAVRPLGGRPDLPGHDRDDDDDDDPDENDDPGDAMTRRPSGNLQKKGCMTPLCSGWWWDGVPAAVRVETSLFDCQRIDGECTGGGGRTRLQCLDFGRVDGCGLRRDGVGGAWGTPLPLGNGQANSPGTAPFDQRRWADGGKRDPYS
jgi:hypothetical protein